jgi:hypothetical protein
MRFWLNRIEVLGLVVGAALVHQVVKAEGRESGAPKGTWSCEAHSTCLDYQFVPGPPPGHGSWQPTVTSCFFDSNYTLTRAEAEADAMNQCLSDSRSFEGSCELGGCQKH